MKKRTLSILLVLAMVLSMIPFSATAAGTMAASPKAGTHDVTGHTCEACGATEWQPWPTSGTLPTEGHYYLTQNVEHTTMVSILANQKLHLCLNGFVITKTTTNRLISVSKTGAEFVLTDCTAYTDVNGVYHAGALTGGVDTGTSGGGAVFVYAEAVMKMYDGIIAGNMHKNDSAGGGAIALRTNDNGDNDFAKGGAFYMYGGELSDNQSYKTNGTSVGTGGAIFAAAGSEVVINGGTIKDNTGSGGAISAKNAPVSISNALITGNTGINGGAIYSEGPLTIADTIITGNTGTSTNTTYGYSAAVLNAGSKSKLTLSGKVIIADNNMYGSVPDMCFTKDATDKVYIHNLTDGSRVVFATPASTVTNANEVILLGTQQTAPWQSGWVKWLSNIKGTGELKDVGLVGGEFVWGHYHGDQKFTALENADQLIAGGNYYLAGDVELAKMAELRTSNMTAHLCLNGHDLTTAADKQIIRLANKSVTLTIDDCTAYTDANGVYHAGSLTGVDSTETGGAVYVGGSDTLYLLDGKISGNTATNAAGAILYGTMYMHGGEISGNTTTKNGAGIYVGKNTGKFYMYGGSITGNTSVKGAAIYVAANTVVELRGGSITNNVATESAAGVWITAGESVTLSGNVQISGNTVGTTASNLYLQENATVIPDNLDSNAQVGITLEEGRALVFTGVLANDPSDCFTSDDSQYKVELVDNKLTLVESGETPPVVVHKHNGCNDTACTDHAQVEFEAWTNATKLPTEGNWYLATDVKVSETITYAANSNKTLNLCLNGHTITQESGTNAQMYHSKANANVVISICDCTAKTEDGVYTAGKITGFTMDGTKSGASEGAVMYLRAGTTLNIFDGIFTGNKTIKKSAGVMLINGVLNIYNGEFSNNEAGGGSYNAGAIYLNADSQATILGGVFRNNIGADGGAIYAMSGIFKNVVFEGNTATDQGGALTLRSTSTAPNTAEMLLENVTITGNTSAAGGAVYVMESLKSLTLKGNTVIENNTSDGKTANLYMDAKEVLTLDGFTGSVGITLEQTGRAFTGNCSDQTANFTSDNDDFVVAYKDGKMWLEAAFSHIHCVCGEAACTQHGVVEFLPWNDNSTLPASGNYCLQTDVTLATTHSVSDNLTLCLHGHTVTISTQNGLISLPNKNITLTITDCTAKTENGVYTAGKLTGGVNTADGGGGAIFIRAGSTLKLYDGIITENKTLRNGGGGGAIMLQSEKEGMISSFYMYGGEISNNKACSADGTADRSGGGIYAYKNSVFVMEGGIIKNNEAANGGGIHASNAKLTLGGTITGNKATKGAGVNMESDTTVTVTGNPVITGNLNGTKASNLCLNGTKKIKAEALDASAQISVSGTALTFITEACNDYTNNFLCDNAKYMIVYKEGALYLDAAGNHKHCFCVATSTHCDHTVQTFVEWDDPTSLPTSGNYYLSVDVELPAQSTLEGTELNLCLNGHTIKIVGQNARAFYTKGDAVLRILDCSENLGKITGGTKGAIVTENADTSNALIELWNGVLTGNQNTSAGGAILLQGPSVFNMYGGKITGNYLPSYVVVDEDGKPVVDASGNQSYTSSHGGGGIAVYSTGSEFHMYGGEISGNKTTMAEYLKNGKLTSAGGFGGGIYAYKGNIYIHDGKIINNYTDRTGGGIFSLTGKTEIYNGEISGNKAETGSGGGIYSSTGTVVNIFGGSITKNQATSGAGLYANTRAVVTMTGGKITNNKSSKSGGGVMISGKEAVMTMSGGEITGNYADGSAGGVLVQSGGTFNLKGAKISNNSCKGNGGGVYISTNSFFNMNGGSITYNHGKGGAGGLLIAANSIGKFYGGSISYNSTDKAAGGVRFNGSTIYMSGTRVVGNKSKSSGSGLMTNKASAKINGVSVEMGVKLTMVNCYIAENVSEGAAGGLLFQSKGTEVKMTNCTVENNKADASGGGMYVSTNVVLVAKDCKFLNNEGGAGGGFRLNNCTATMDNIVVSGNKGQGLVAAGAACKATLTNFEVYNNTHSSASGLQINSGANVVVTDTRIYGNEAVNSGAGLYIGGTSTATIKNVDIFENTAANGGGYYSGAGSRINLENVDIHDNTASAVGGGMYVAGDVTMKNSTVNNNKSGGSGGGIHTWKVSSRYTADDGALKMIDCQVDGNTAGGQGGGMYVFRGGPARITSTVFTGNSSDQEGGGIYCEGIMDLTDVTVTDNRSGGTGYALYLAPMEWDGHSYTNGYKRISGNMIVQDNEGGNMYVDTAAVVAVDGATLGPKAVVKVTLADGLLTKKVIGVYHYEGEGLHYTLTAGDRSITQPMQEAGDGPSIPWGNIALYGGIGIFTVAVAAAVVLILLKKKNGAKNVSKI